MNKIHNNCGLCRIEIKNLSVRDGNDFIINDITTEFHCGQLTALIGKNGAGKTTLLKAMLGERKYSGSISYFQHDNASMKRPVTGYVPQQLNFDKSTPVSVLDFICASSGSPAAWLGHSSKSRENAKAKLETLGCQQLLNKRLGDLSGGELQRVLLAVAIDPLPDLLILDEPVSGVDVNGLDLFYNMVTMLLDKYHMAILLVSHDLNLIEKYADKALLIDKTILAQGDVSAVFKTDAFKNAFGYLSLETVEDLS